MQKINLIRHGKTNDNGEARYSGRIESKLIWTQEEIQDIILPKLSIEEMGSIYSSPRQRALETARPFEKYGKKIIIEKDIGEIDFGIYEGLTYDEITSQYPKEVEKWLMKKNDYVFPEGDSLTSFFNRVVKGFDRILKRNPNEEHITIFTHGGVIQCLISYLLSNSLDLFWNFKIDNCSLTQFYFSDDEVVFEKINI